LSLPRFFSRVADAIQPVAAINPAELAGHLEDTTIAIHAPSSAADDLVDKDAASLAVNLAARLYPRIHISGPAAWTDSATSLAAAINPAADIDTATQPPASARSVTLDWVSDPARSASNA